MDWTTLLSHKRLGRATADPLVGRTEFQRDRDRIVFSQAFRRLADKTQVHPLSENDHIRTRLTHSIEVASVGRSLGMLVGKEVVKRHNLGELAPHDFANIVEAACLAHDLGNPPFGHSGESAISMWFCSQRGADLLRSLSEQQQQDFKNFEGNAQGFRILSNLENYESNGGLQLTHAVLGTFTKYPRISTPADASTYVGHKKHGFFAAETPYFREISQNLGLPARPDEHEAWCRHPLAFLTEAADDICYIVADLEDGYELGRITFNDALCLLNQIAQRSRHQLDQIDDQRRIGYLRAVAINTLIQSVSEEFLQNEKDILDGRFGSEGEGLLKKTSYYEALQEIQELTRQKIFRSDIVLPVEIAGYETIAGLLEIFSQVIKNLEDHKFDCSYLNGRDSKIVNYCGIDLTRCKDKYHSLLRVTDYVSGMTDSYAVKQYQILKGIRVR